MDQDCTSYWRKKFYVLFCLLGITISITASQYLKVDLNMSGRSLTEVGEPGYTSWVVKTGQSDSATFDNGVTIVLTSRAYGNLRPNWYKAGISQARLSNDGVCLTDTIQIRDRIIEMKIKGLTPGKHSILTYHNHVDNPSVNVFPAMDIYKDGVLVTENFVSTVRVENNADAAKFFTEVVAEEGKDVVFLYKAKSDASVTNMNLIINGIEIDTQNADTQAKIPVPSDRDEHVNADNKTVLLSWSAADGAISHKIYFGIDSLNVSAANEASLEYKGTQSNTSFQASDIYSMLTYYWRIDEVDSEGNISKGNVWYFRPRQLAFEGAEGYGRFARGGRGGIVIKVTNLNDSGSGSLRDAVENPLYTGKPRIIVFDVSGRIELKSRLSVNKPYITIAGQTAPGKGICVSGHAFGVGGVNDMIIRHMRLRVGTDDTTDGMGQSGANHSIIDHASISWSKDEATSSRDAFNITFQRSLISEPLNRAGHKNYPKGTAHGYAGSIGGDIASYHHNLLAHSYGRNWSLAGGLDGNGNYKGRLDIFNNVIYNWGTRTTDGGAHEVNFVANYYKPGVETSQFRALNAQWDGFPGSQKYYCNGNIVEGRYEDLSNPKNGCTSDSKNPDPWSDTPFFPSYATIHSAKDAYKHVLSDVGATQPVFDDHDIRVVRETMEGSWTYRGSYNSPNGTRGVIDHQNDVGGWEDYGNVKRAVDFDSDNDGLPDWWENIIGTNPNSSAGDFSDTNADSNGDGFTNMDNYLDWMAEPHYTVQGSEIIAIDLQKLSQGFVKSPSYIVSDLQKCNVTLQNDIALVSAADNKNALASFKFTVTDSEGTNMTRRIGLRLSSDETGINSERSDSDFHVSFNNPVEHSIRLNVSSDQATDASIEIVNLLGKTVLNSRKIFTNEVNDIDVSSLSRGIYVLKVNHLGKVQTYKFMKL